MLKQFTHLHTNTHIFFSFGCIIFPDVEIYVRFVELHLRKNSHSCFRANEIPSEWAKGGLSGFCLFLYFNKSKSLIYTHLGRTLQGNQDVAGNKYLLCTSFIFYSNWYCHEPPNSSELWSEHIRNRWKPFIIYYGKCSIVN